MMKGFSRILVFSVAAMMAFAQGNAGNQGKNNPGSQGNAHGNNPKQASDFSKYTSGGLVDVIVQFRQTPNQGLINQLQQFWDQGDQQDAQNEKNRGQDKHSFGAINALHLKVPASAIPIISAMPAVAYVSPVRPVKRSLDIVDATVAANVAWNYGWNGTGVGVAVIDSGIAPNDDFMDPTGTRSRLVYSESFVSGTDASDQYGHGTHVAGIVGANGKDSSGPGFSRTFKGVAPNVNLINLRVLDSNGGGQESDVIAAILRAIQLKNTYNIRVINLSLGRPVFESYQLDPLCQAVEAAWKAGIVVVTAAGNAGRDNSLGTNGYGTIISPGNDPCVITVGATKTNGTPYRWDDSIASYSSKGPTLVDHIVKPDLVAPGNNVVSVLAPNSTLARLYPTTLISAAYYLSDVENIAPAASNYFRLSGTSMATPVVAGAAALLIQQNPSITPDQVKARLMKTAGKLLPMYSTSIAAWSFQSFFNQSDIFTIGAGYLDVNAALTNTDLVMKPALSPTAKIDPITGRITIIRDLTNCWGSGLVWGDTLVWGSSVFAGQLLTGSTIVWGDTVVWGSALDPGFAIVWGDTVNPNSTLQATSDDDSDQ